MSVTGAGSGLIHRRALAVAARFPDRPAIRSEGGPTVSYGQLASLAAAVARGLEAMGAGEGDVVAVLADRRASLVWALLGILERGAAFTVVDGRSSPRGAAERLAGLGVELAIRLQPPGEAPPVPPGLVVAGVEEVVEAGLARSPGPPGGRDRGADPPAYVATTSGTTGAPRAIEGTHGPVAHFLDWYARRFALGRDDRFCLVSGLSHDPALRDVLTPLWVGATLAVPTPATRANPRRLGEWLAAERVTVLHVVPTLAASLARGAPDAGLPDLRLVVAGGEPLTAGHVRLVRSVMPNARLVNAYGATETPQIVAYHELGPDEDAGGEASVPITDVVDGWQVTLADEHGRPVAGHGPGQLLVTSPHLTTRYLGDDDANERRYVEDGHGVRTFRTGDVGLRRSDGAIVVTGRADRQAKIGGERVELDSVQSAVRSLPGVLDAAVAAEPREEAGISTTELVAYVVPCPGAGGAAGAREYQRELRRRANAHEVPARWVLVDALPPGANGKIDYELLRRAHGAREPAGAAAITDPPPGPDDLLPRVLVLCREVLDAAALGADDDLFAAGADSLTLVDLLLRMREELSRDCPIEAVLDRPTPRGLVDCSEALTAWT